MKFLLVDNGLPFNLTTLHHSPLGGSESSLLLLANGLSELHNPTVILSTTTHSIPARAHNLLLHNTNTISNFIEESDIIILNRCLKEEALHSNKPIYYYCHDAYDQPILNCLYNKDIINRIAKILCVSEWQKQTLIKYYQVPENKLSVLYNPIDTSMYAGYAKRNPNKLIFASIPYKGLEILPDLFNQICITSKREDLELHIYSSMKLYQDNHGDKQYEQAFSQLARTKNVFIFDPIFSKDLAYEFLTAGIYLHPNTYHETFGKNLVEAQCGGCIPITTNNGAVQEVINNKATGFILDYPNIQNHDCFNAMVNKTCELLETDLYKYRLQAHDYSRQFDYIKIARRLLDLL